MYIIKHICVPFPTQVEYCAQWTPYTYWIKEMKEVVVHKGSYHGGKAGGAYPQPQPQPQPGMCAALAAIGYRASCGQKPVFHDGFHSLLISSMLL